MCRLKTMYIHITDLDEFKKILDYGTEEYESVTGETGGSIVDISDTISSVEVEDEHLDITTGDENVGYTFEIPTDLITEDIIKLAIKKMNKIKTMLESLK